MKASWRLGENNAVGALQEVRCHLLLERKHTGGGYETAAVTSTPRERVCAFFFF
jgi:hypothetical protein